MKRPLIHVAAAALLLLSLAGCSTGNTVQVSLPEKNLGQWALPLDAYTYDSGSVRDYAEALLDKNCYAQSGIDWPVPWQPENRDMRGASFTAGGLRLFTPELAAEYGYHTAPKTYEGFEDWREFVSVSASIAESTPGFEDVSAACLSKTREAIPLPSDDTMFYASGAASDLYTKALTDPDVVAAAAAWSTCMTEAGFGGFAPTPDQMPGEQMVTTWQVAEPFTQAGADEKAVATADAGCRNESGWAEAFYAANWDEQVAFVEANGDRLGRVAAELATEHDALMAAIAENAPAK